MPQKNHKGKKCLHRKTQTTTVSTIKPWPEKQSKIENKFLKLNQQINISLENGSRENKTVCIETNTNLISITNNTRNKLKQQIKKKNVCIENRNNNSTYNKLSPDKKKLKQQTDSSNWNNSNNNKNNNNNARCKNPSLVTWKHNVSTKFIIIYRNKRDCVTPSR